MMNELARWVREKYNRRPADFEIIKKDGSVYLRRWWIFRSRFGSLYLHHFLGSDDDRALHDHPYLFNASYLIDGYYYEHLPGGRLEFRWEGQWYFRWGRAAHRVQLLFSGRKGEHNRELPCWTLFLAGPRVREWGFYCPKGWRHWRVFTSTAEGSSVGGGKSHIGRGCE